MNELFSVVLTALLAFMVADHALARGQVADPLRAVIASIFAVLLVLVSGALVLADVIDL